MWPSGQLRNVKYNFSLKRIRSVKALCSPLWKARRTETTRTAGGLPSPAAAVVSGAAARQLAIPNSTIPIAVPSQRAIRAAFMA